MTDRFQSQPLPVEAFAHLGKRAGSRSLCLSMAGLAITLEGLEEDLASRMETRYASYLADHPARRTPYASRSSPRRSIISSSPASPPGSSNIAC